MLEGGVSSVGRQQVSPRGDFHGMIGRSPAMKALYERVCRIARAAGPVLISGESGVGKELITRALHEESDRASGPLVPVNCAGIPAELLESELFGHACGAFTGAQRARSGLFAAAHGGTLLLDEIGELPAGMQAKLLRALQDGRVRPVGANIERTVDVRVVAATNRNLEREVVRKTFREDLFYRLSTFKLRIPPLRQRGEDLTLLAEYFTRHFSAKLSREIAGVGDDALSLLRRYPFPGNVRELASMMEQAVAFCRGKWIAPADLPEELHGAQAGVAPDGLGADLRETDSLPTLRAMQLRYINHVLDQVQGNKRLAAAILGIGRRTLYRYLQD
jgi:transcriptional regulator with PAS, ATPase and Fis domain